MSVTLTIDGKTISVAQGTTVYHAVTSLGIEVPIFCYQDRMPPFGACRVCLVEVEKFPKLQTSCTLVATEGMVVKTQSQMAVDGRQKIIEFLLINHPLDCPICDRGGECPLQEQTLKFGPGMSRFFEDKRRFIKPIPLGPVLMLDRERCIVCARCTRFSDIVSKDNALEFLDRGFRTEVGTPDGGPADSKFIGNTIMICPVGALTSDVYRFRARPWDNASTDSTCTLCPVGCSLILDTRDGEIMRTRSREDKNVNDIWLCDKGWFGYEFSSSENRLRYPLLRKGESLSQVSWNEALEFVAQKFNLAKESGKLAAWGGNPLTVEENYLFQRIFRERGGVDHVDHRVGETLFSLEEEGLPAGMDINLNELDGLNTIYLLGLDITEEFPVIWLRLSQAINKGAKVTFIGNFGTEISRHLDKVIIHEPGKELENLSNLEFKDKSAIFIGKQYLSSPSRKAILGLIKDKYPNVSLNILEGRGNGMGARWAGMRPDVGPMGRPLVKSGLNPEQVVDQGLNEGWDFLYVAGANPARKFPTDKWNNFKNKLGCLVVQDIFLTDTARMADVVLPTLSYVEKGGSFINIEGRVQTLMPGKVSEENIFSDGEIFMKVAQKLNFPMKLDPELAKQLSQPKIPFNRPDKITGGNAVPNNNDLSLSFSVKLFDEGVRMRESPHVIELAKKPVARLNENEARKRNVASGQTIKISANGASIEAPVLIDNTVADKVVVLPLGFSEVPVHEFGTSLLNGMKGEIHV